MAIVGGASSDRRVLSEIGHFLFAAIRAHLLRSTPRTKYMFLIQNSSKGEQEARPTTKVKTRFTMVTETKR